MKTSRSFQVGVAVVVVAIIGVILFLNHQRPRAKAPGSFLANEPTPTPPTLLAPPADASVPAPAWRWLLAADGSPQQDLTALQDMVANLLQSVPVNQRPPLGFDTDLARALSDPAWMGDAALPPTHPALREGRLIDRWGRPWLIHPQSADRIQVRSAGPDGKLFTADDLVAPRDVVGGDKQ